MRASAEPLSATARYGPPVKDALAGDLEDAADLFEGVGVAVADAVAQADDLALAVGEGVEDLGDLLLEHLVGGDVGRVLDRLVLQEVAEVAVVAVADGTVERDRMLGDLDDASMVASRPVSWRMSFWIFRSLPMVSIMWTGMRMVRAWSAIARVMPWRIHQVA